MSVQFSISAIGGRGPKSTAINFLKSENGERLWAWIPNEKADNARPGMVVKADGFSLCNKVETSYEDKKSGDIVELKVPKRQVFLDGDIVIDAPESEPVQVKSITITDAALAYAKAYDAKRAEEVGTNNDNASF